MSVLWALVIAVAGGVALGRAERNAELVVTALLARQARRLARTLPFTAAAEWSIGNPFE